MYGLNDRPTIWVVDDDKSIRWVLDKALQKSRLPYRMFADGREVLDALDFWNNQPENKRQAGDYPALLLSDIRMPDVNGIELLREFKKLAPEVPVVMMTAHSDLENAVSTFQEGAAEYIAKPFDTEELVALIKRFVQPIKVPAMTNSADSTSTDADGFEQRYGLLGHSSAILQVLRTVGRLSATEVNVLLTGETGTGKELVARAIHATGVRANAPFIAISTAAIPAHMLESELFGHEKGAFTGAGNARMGRFEEAEGGTLFLDEIGDMPFETQTRLLRVLADGEFYRVGGHIPVKVDVRIVAATHQDLEKLVQDGRFREDLYHRLNVIRIHIPKLAHRSEDIPMLAQHFLARAGKELGVSPKILRPETVEYMQQLPWQGNVRQLENTCRWLTVMITGREVYPEDLPTELKQIPIEKLAEHSALHVADRVSMQHWDELLGQWAVQKLKNGEMKLLDIAIPMFERTLINAALQQTRGRKRHAAEVLGWGRNTLTRKLKELGMDSADDEIEEDMES